MLRLLLGCAAFAALAAMPDAAQAWWRGGVFIGGPVVVGPPVAYPPPYYPYPYYPYGYYPPAPGYGQPPPPQSQQQAAPQQSPIPQQAQAQAYGSTCYAGVYVCPAPGATPAGSGCSCPGLGAPSYGVVQ